MSPVNPAVEAFARPDLGGRRGVESLQRAAGNAATSSLIRAKLAADVHGDARPAAVQRYFEGTVEGAAARISDTAAVVQEKSSGGRYLYAAAGMAGTSNQALKGQIDLQEGQVAKRSVRYKDAGGTTQDVKKDWALISPFNKSNQTSGPSMKLWADCNRANMTVIGAATGERAAVFQKKGAELKTSYDGNPSIMKVELMESIIGDYVKTIRDQIPQLEHRIKTNNIMKLFHKSDDPEYKKYQATIDDDTKRLELAKKAIKTYDDSVAKAQKIKLEIAAIKSKTPVEWDKIWPKYSTLGDTVFTFYNSLSGNDRKFIDSAAKINQWANPKVGQGYTMSTGSDTNTWPFHWAGVVMKSADDNITLENYSVSDWNKENDKWVFQMYGTKRDAGQTFHEQHEASGTHGTTPTTMTVEPK